MMTTKMNKVIFVHETLFIYVFCECFLEKLIRIECDK